MCNGTDVVNDNLYFPRIFANPYAHLAIVSNHDDLLWEYLSMCG